LERVGSPGMSFWTLSGTKLCTLSGVLGTSRVERIRFRFTSKTRGVSREAILEHRVRPGKSSPLQAVFCKIKSVILRKMGSRVRLTLSPRMQNYLAYSDRTAGPGN
jgi:hypothetical protein